MQTIELERWGPSAENPRMVQYIGQRNAQEVFAELRHCLQSTGTLPDEYFEMDTMWENREIPKDADVFCTTDYGGSEGIYLDVYLKWYEEGKSITKSFITGKTLGENGADLDRMFLVASAITKAFHGDNATHARYMLLGDGSQDIGGGVFHLNQTEKRLLIDSLLASRNQLMEQTVGVEQLLRRITGSITEYVNEVGRRPLQISNYDMAVLAVQDGNLEAFKTTYSKVPEQLGDLLIEAAGRPGGVGRTMVLLLLCDSNEFSNEEYLAACKKAVDTGDPVRVLFMAEQAETCVDNLNMSLFGEIIEYSYPEKGYISQKLIEQCTPEQVAAASPYLLYKAAMRGDEHTCAALVGKGIDANEYAAEVIRNLYAKRGPWPLKHLLEDGMHIDIHNYSALHACIQTDQLDAGEMLLDRGMDFDDYKVWAAKQQSDSRQSDIVAALTEYWNNQKNAQEQDDAPEPEGPTLE